MGGGEKEKNKKIDRGLTKVGSLWYERPQRNETEGEQKGSSLFLK
jgi:hypothetical protein